MKIVLAPNALKGCLTATEAAEAMARGVARACPTAEIACVPVADGGDGLADVLVNALSGETLTVTVTDPRGDPVSASFCHVLTRRQHPRVGIRRLEPARVQGQRPDPVEEAMNTADAAISAHSSRRTASSHADPPATAVPR